MTFLELLIQDEGFKTKPYKCTQDKLTIGIGRNLEDVGLSEDEVHYLAKNDIARCERESMLIPWFSSLNHVRQLVVLSMLYIFGSKGFKEFKKMNLAIEKGEFHLAAQEMKDSKWYHQATKRVERLCHMMETGELNKI